MDVFAHGFWGAIAFGKKQGRRGIKALSFAFVIGMMPDLFSFGLWFFERALQGFPPYPIEPGTSGAPAIASLPGYVSAAYNVTHSLVVWAAAFVVLYALFKRKAWIFAAWGLHILCDIPTHTTRYFPTPFLWPFPTPYVDGVPWSTPWFMALNYGAIISVVTFSILGRAGQIGRQ